MTRNSTEILAVSITIVALILAFSIAGLGQEEVQTPSEELDGEEEVQTPSEMAKIGYRNVGSVMSSVTGAETDKSELVKQALSNLFDELADHMEEKDVPGHVVEKFRKRAQSVETMYESNLLTSEQLGSEASRIVKSAGREDPGGGVPASVLKKAGLGREDVKELTEKDPDKEKATKVVRKMARKGEKDEEEKDDEDQDRERDNNEKGNEGKPEMAGGPDKGDRGKKKGNAGDENEVASTDKGDSSPGKSGRGGSNRAGPPGQEDEEKSNRAVNKDKSDENGSNPPDHPGNGNNGNSGRGNAPESDDEEEDNNGKGNPPGKGKGRGN